MSPRSYLGRFVFPLVLIPCFAACESAPNAPHIDYAPLPDANTAQIIDPEAQAQDVSVGVTDNAYADTDPSALTDFQQPLAPYGTWIDDPNYGTVWQPNADQVGSDFTPYLTGGHWTYDRDEDYVWASDWAWGWIPFHYGRWQNIAGHGWCWTPGRQYAGAWVNWRVGDGYLGWAPMEPAWGWRNGAAFGIPNRPAPAPFVFRPRENIFSADMSDRVLTGQRAENLARASAPYNRPGTVIPASHPIAQPAMRGPAPRSLGIDESSIVRPAPTDRGVMRAREFARPVTAVPSGAQAPSVHMVHTAPPVVAPPPPHTAPVRSRR